jgi:isoleucyl-tRNA synthetase
LVRDVEQCYEDYEPTRAGRLIQNFVVDNVSNWFVRLSKKRFWGGEMTIDKLSAYQTLYTCLETVARLMAPIAPYYADRLYRDLHEGRGEAEVRSVHLAKFPVADTSIIDVEQEERMALAQQVTSMIHSLRKKEAISVKQPLQRIAIPALNAEQQERIEAMKQLILDEVNVKEIEFVEGAGMLVKKVKCNFRTMGKKFGKQMKAVAAAVSAMGQEQISMLEQGSVTLCVEGVDALIELEDVEIYSEDIPGWSVANAGTLTVALDLTITEELRLEGMAREIIRSIQQLRKDSGFEITDRIIVTLPDTEETRSCLDANYDYVASQVLATEVRFAGDAIAVEKV